MNSGFGQKHFGLYVFVAAICNITAPQANRPQGTPVSGNESDKAFAIGGGQAGGYQANLDGVTILTGRYSSVQWSSVNTPSIDAITEFAVETNGFKAEYGRAQGGVITFTSKSGTNELHGTVYEFLRNDALDARRFFEAKKGVYKQNDFGWSAGAPAVRWSFRNYTMAVIEASGLPAWNGSATVLGPTANDSASLRPRCTAATSATG